MNLHFVTSNPNKFRELSELLECNLSRIELDLQEIQTTDLHELVKFKLRQAYEHVQAPVIVEDTSLYFEAWNELPGPLVKFFLKNIGLSGMVMALDEFSNNSASAACCLGYTKDKKNMHLFGNCYVFPEVFSLRTVLGAPRIFVDVACYVKKIRCW